MTTNDKARLEHLLRRYFEEKAQPQAPIVWHVDKTPMQKAIVDLEDFFDSIHGGHGDIDDSCTCHLGGQTCDACNEREHEAQEIYQLSEDRECVKRNLGQVVNGEYDWVKIRQHDALFKAISRLAGMEVSNG